MNMKMKKVFGILLSLVMVLGLVPGMTMTVLADDVTDLTDSLPTTGGNYRLTQSISIGSTWEVPGAVTLDLNGFNITKTGNSGPAIEIGSGKSLILNDSGTGGKITGGKGSKSYNSAGFYVGGGVIVDGGSFTMNSGTITGNTVNGNYGDDGGGVWVGNYGTFTMNGGVISGNTAAAGGGGGVGIGINGWNSSGATGTFIMNGGEIRGNTSNHGSAIRINNGTFTMTGGSISGSTPAVYLDHDGDKHNTFNLSGTISLSSVLLEKEMKINVTGGLSNTNKIGVTMLTPGVFTSSTDPYKAKDYIARFKSDDYHYTVEADGNELKLSSVTLYPIWVGGTQVTSENAANITGGETVTASYDVSSNTLTLNGYEHEGDGTIYTENASLKIELIGTNTVANTSVAGYGVYALRCALTITGSGTLNAIGTQGGIFVERDTITIENGTVNATGEQQSGIGGGENSNIIIKGGTVNAKATADARDGISFMNGVNITGGTVTANGKGSGISSETNVKITGGNVTAIGGSTAGIWAGNGPGTGPATGSVSITGGTVEATASGENGKGIYAQLEVSISGGEVTAKGAKAAIESTVYNSIAGTGWTDTAGTTGKKAIPVNTEGQQFDYKMVQFPEVKDKYTVTVTNDGNGTGAANPASGVEGTEVTLTAKPNDGYTFKEWQVVSGGVTVKENKFRIGTANVVVKAIFEKNAAIVYTFTEGGGAEWTKGAEAGLNFTIKGSPDDAETFAKFTGIASDDSAVDVENYTATAGSVKLSLKAAWLETLTAGKHTLTANFTDGKAEASFTVKDAAPAPTPTPKPKPVPKTGDGAPLALWIGLILIGMIGLGTFIALRRRTQKK